MLLLCFRGGGSRASPLSGASVCLHCGSAAVLLCPIPASVCPLLPCLCSSPMMAVLFASCYVWVSHGTDSLYQAHNQALLTFPLWDKVYSLTDHQASFRKAGLLWVSTGAKVRVWSRRYWALSTPIHFNVLFGDALDLVGWNSKADIWLISTSASQCNIFVWLLSESRWHVWLQNSQFLL